MSKHTPGPWIYEVDAAHAYVRGDEHSEEGRPIRDQLVAKVWLQGPEFSEANARLITAAPDLLEALKDIVDNEELLSHHEGSLKHKEEATKRIKKAWDAIAKAEGK